MSDDTKEEVRFSAKEKKFIDEWLVDFNATRAARDSGYSEKTASVIGWENLRKPKIKAEIERRLDEVRMSKPETIRLISDIARGDMGEFLDIGGMGFSLNLEAAKEKGITKLIKKVKQKTTIFIAKKESDEDKEVHEIEIELYSAADALVTMAKHHKLLTDTVALTGEHGGPVEINHKVDDARFDRALSSLADAIRESLPGAGAKSDGAVDAPE